MAVKVEESVRTFDVAIIGAGVVGCAIARELAQYDLSIILLEAKADVGDATSKANTAILHTGFDMTPGTLESTLVRRGYSLLKDYAQESGISLEATGAILVAWNDDEFANLDGIIEKSRANGYFDAVRLKPHEIYEREPNLGEGVLGGVLIPGEWIIDPWNTPIAFATQAKRAGVVVKTSTKVKAIRPGNLSHLLETNQGEFQARYLVNAAGLNSDEIDQEIGYRDFKVIPRRGELMVFDKFARDLVSHIILPVPSKMGKGVLISPTVFGNVMLGPTAEDLEDKNNSASSKNGLGFLRNKASKIMPALLEEEVTAIYAGLRASTEHSEYQVRLHEPERYVTVGGIRSTGLTASMALAEHVSDLLSTSGLVLGTKRKLPAIQMREIGEKSCRPFKDEALISQDSRNGQIICHCEKVTQSEIEDALNSEIPAKDLKGLGRRTRAGLGRCQGFYCHAALRRLMASAT